MPISLQRRGTLFILAAPSGGGKSTVLKAVLERVEQLAYSISVTSRPPRGAETPGKDFHFVSEDEFNGMIERKEFYEWAKVHGNYYGTRKQTVEDLLDTGSDVAMDLDVQGAYSIRGMKPESVTIFLLPPSMSVLEDRLRGRGTDDEEVIQLRLRNAAVEIAQCRMFDYLVVNDELDCVVTQIGQIVEAERHRGIRQELIVKDEPQLQQHLPGH